MGVFHHTQIIIGGDEARNLVNKMLLENFGFQTEANPDFFDFAKDPFGISDTRDIIEWAVNKPFSGDIKACLITTSNISHEAQNAFLKILEEPPLGTYFFISIPNVGGLLPTLLSRVRIIEIPKNKFEENNETKSKALEFIDSKIDKRFSMINHLAKMEDKKQIRDFINDIESIARNHYLSKKNVNLENNAKKLKNILEAKVLNNARGASPKMILEWLATVV